MLYLIFSFSILIWYLWTSKCVEMGQIFGSPYHVDNYWFFGGFFWEPANVPIVHVGLPSNFDAQMFTTSLL